ncbi:MarR family winged helix-turn-helix transcriptional regulator [Cellulomonas soli]|uniref:HTH marR-type domain-containing protein n=1 Tax=Cellulomonas soli TaxID=931535 RepID=A0A512PAC7_9CELL|nr:MarR family transcriptional regulator [Cellulomonas soli]NYI60655.1 DNA-binding MarR family transcriptional regulator [Cellulomonas soli]GEP68170.1 hypothetical protein CSO01_08850 [Cellulomonas soli]
MGTALSQLIGPLRRGIHRVSRADDVSARVTGSQVAERHVTEPQIEVLRLLASGGAAWSTGTLAVRLDLAPSTLSNLLKAMERGGLITRTRVVDDQRRVDVAVQESGLEALRRHDAHVAHVLDGYLAGLSEHDRDALERALPALARLTDALGGASAGSR